MHAPAQPTIPPEMLLLAYRSGIFPMADGREDPEIFYVEPRRRAILPLDGFRCSRSLARLLRQERYRVTCNEDFAGVIAACAESRPEHPETWISRRIEASYRKKRTVRFDPLRTSAELPMLLYDLRARS